MKRPFTKLFLLLPTALICIVAISCSKKTETVVDKPTTAIEYVNTTHTPITITVNDSTRSIPVAGTLSFRGYPGDTANVSANTKGMIGETIVWNNLNTVFPASGTQTTPLYVDSTYFFFEIGNGNPLPVVKFYIYYGMPYQISGDINIPGDSVLHSIGYFKEHSDSLALMTIRTVLTDSTASNADLYLLHTRNDYAVLWW